MTNLKIERVEHYSPDIAAGIGCLMPTLDRGFDQTHSDGNLRLIIDSPYYDQLVARRGDEVVGAATMNQIAGVGRGRFGQLEDFVVSDQERGQGVAPALWQAMLQWCRDKGLVGFDLNTEAHRGQAINFYRKVGARAIAGTRGHFTALVEEITPPSNAADVAEVYGHSRQATIEQLSGGLINQTFLVTENGRQQILQRLHAAFNDQAIRDNIVVSEHMASQGWETARTIAAKNGAYWLKDSEGAFWRAQSFLESDGVLPKPSEKALWTAGMLLAKWHRSLARLDYQPEFKLEHYHDTAYHIGRLADLKTALPSLELQQMADAFLTAYDGLPEIQYGVPQLIHSDPQLKNMLFREGRAFTMIDLDPLMFDSTWLDLGDLIRSSIETWPSHNPRPLIEAYRQNSQPDSRPERFHKTARAAGQLIALELGTRFLNDIVDDDYFAWDPGFDSRQSHHATRAMEQWQIYGALNV